jgi:hypothetical protein
MRSPRYGKVSTAPEHLAIERLALVRRRGIADAEHAADVQHLNHIARLERLGNVARVAEQRLAMPERADHDVAAGHLRHAAAGELQRVVGGLVVQDLDHHHHAFLAGNVRRDPNLVRQAERLGDRGDLVDHHRAHAAHDLLPAGVPARPTRRAVENSRQRQHLRISEGIDRRPLAGGLAIHALRCRHERMRRVTPSTKAEPGRSSTSPRR